MSLINKMLQDLDARGGKAGAAPGQMELRPVNTPRKRALPVVLGVGAVAVVAMAAGSWYGWHYFTRHTVKPRPAPVMVVVPQAPVPATVPATVQTSVSATVPAAVQIPVPASAPAPVLASAATASAHGAEEAATAGRRGRAAASPALSDEADRHPPRALPREHARERKVHPKDRHGDEKLAGRHSDKSRQGTKPAQPAEDASGAGGVSRDLGPAQLAENRYRRALLDLQEGRTSEALVELQHAVELAPRHEAARQTLVTLLIENRRTEEAVQQLQQALALDARQPDMAMLLAGLQLESGGPALDTLLRTLPYAADNAEYQGFVAGVLQRAQRHGEAVEHYQAALKLAPQKGVWWMGLGISLQAEKRLSEARIAYTRAKAAGGMTPELLAFVDRKLEALGR